MFEHYVSAASYYNKTEFKFAFRLPPRLVIFVPLGWVFGSASLWFWIGFGLFSRMPHCEFNG